MPYWQLPGPRILPSGRIFPHEQSCLRLIRALAAEQDEEWLDGPLYLDMQPLRDQLKPALQIAA